MSTNTQTAHIKTLTASVRMVEVDGRMVTVSMVKQLDVIDVADMKVIMGRVNLPNSARPHESPAEFSVIGADREGRLRLAWVDPYQANRNHSRNMLRITARATSEKFRVCQGKYQRDKSNVRIDSWWRCRWGEREIYFAQLDTIECRPDRTTKACDCPNAWDASNTFRRDEAYADLRKAWERISDRPDKVREALDSEAIVLAGYR